MKECLKGNKSTQKNLIFKFKIKYFLIFSI